MLGFIPHHRLSKAKFPVLGKWVEKPSTQKCFQESCWFLSSLCVCESCWDVRVMLGLCIFHLSSLHIFVSEQQALFMVLSAINLDFRISIWSYGCTAYFSLSFLWTHMFHFVLGYLSVWSKCLSGFSFFIFIFPSCCWILKYQQFKPAAAVRRMRWDKRRWDMVVWDATKWDEVRSNDKIKYDEVKWDSTGWETKSDEIKLRVQLRFDLIHCLILFHFLFSV